MHTKLVGARTILKSRGNSILSRDPFVAAEDIITYSLLLREYRYNVNFSSDKQECNGQLRCEVMTRHGDVC